jgi:hypothetical protein
MRYVYWRIVVKLSAFIFLWVLCTQYITAKVARGGADSWGTALQAGRWRVPFPMVSLEFFIDIILPGSLRLWDRLSLLTGVSTTDTTWGKGGRCIGLTILPLSCANCLELLEASNICSLKGLSKALPSPLHKITKKEEVVSLQKQVSLMECNSCSAITVANRSFYL